MLSPYSEQQEEEKVTFLWFTAPQNTFEMTPTSQMSSTLLPSLSWQTNTNANTITITNTHRRGHLCVNISLQHGVWEEGRPLTLLMKLSFENLAQGGDWLHLNCKYLQVTIFLDELVPFLRLWLHFSWDIHIHHHQLMGLQPEQTYNANEEAGLLCQPRSSSSPSKKVHNANEVPGLISLEA